MTQQLPTEMRELDTRLSDGIHVRLLWDEGDGQLVVSVTDVRTGAAFCLEVREHEEARDVFHHPYAYAAWHGVDTAIQPSFSEPEQSGFEDVSLAA